MNILIAVGVFAIIYSLQVTIPSLTISVFESVIGEIQCMSSHNPYDLAFFFTTDMQLIPMDSSRSLEFLGLNLYLFLEMFYPTGR